jgi:hypothetical protein
MPPVIKFVAKTAVVVIILLGTFLVGGSWALVKYETHGVDSFCREISESDTAQAIIDLSKPAGLFFTRWQNTDDIWILNKTLEAPPMFRIACAVAFKDGKVTDTKLIDAD